MTNNKTIFVTGATGNQGGAVARNLARAGFTVKALTRNTQSAKALELSSLNIALIKGDLNDTQTFRNELKNIYGIFSVQTFQNGIRNEIHQGTALASLAKEVGINHFLYSSVSGADSNTGVPHMDSKFTIENHIRRLSIPFTIIRPAGFYENFLHPQVKKGILKGKLVQPGKPDTVMQYIAADDIGKAAARIFMQGEKYIDKTLPLAAERLSNRQIAEEFSSVLHKKIKYQKLPGFLSRIFLGNTLFKMFKLLDEKTFFKQEDMVSTRKEFPDLLSLKNWIAINFKS